MKKKILLLPGDGIGREVMQAALPAMETMAQYFTIEWGEIGWECWRREGNPVPAETWKKIHTADAVLLGAVTSKPEREAQQELDPNLPAKELHYVSPVVQLRKKLNLYANVRPIWSINNFSEFQVTIIRENTEGLYSGLDYYPVAASLKPYLGVYGDLPAEEIACSLRIQTRAGLERVYRYSFEYAKKYGLQKVTLADKPNVLRASGAFAREIFEEVAATYAAAGITADIQNVDAVALWLVRKPEKFDVIVAENMFGDILSDVGAGVMGGLGFAPSANIGDHFAYFEPVHGSAPQMTPNKANPSAMFLTIALLWEHFGYTEQAQRLRNAVKQTMREGETLSYDVGGDASTQAVAQTILRHFTDPQPHKTIGLLVVGDEITRGALQDTNSHTAAKLLNENDIEVKQIIQVKDDLHDIQSALHTLLGKCDTVISFGGLGPTTDDITRVAIAKIVGKPLLFNKNAWQHLVARLQNFGLEVSAGNKMQALFPAEAALIPNSNGTACGAVVARGIQNIFMLPGPPREVIPMLTHSVLPQLRADGYAEKFLEKTCMLFGVIEGEVSDFIKTQAGFTARHKLMYLWRYPYVQVSLRSKAQQDIAIFINAIHAHFGEVLVQWSPLKASEVLAEFLTKTNKQIAIVDNLTQNKFTAIHENIQPYTAHTCHTTLDLLVRAEGLTELYAGKSPGGQTEMRVLLTQQGVAYDKRIKIPYRGPEVQQYAVEFLAFEVVKYLSGRT